MKTCHLNIGGMNCSSCANRIEQALARLEGVHTATVSFPAEQAQVVYDPGTVDEQMLADTVRATGFEPSAPTATSAAESRPRGGNQQSRSHQFHAFTIRKHTRRQTGGFCRARRPSGAFGP